MQRHKFMVPLVVAERINRTIKQSDQQVHTFSDCIKESAYTAPENKAIHVRNAAFDQRKNLI